MTGEQKDEKKVLAGKARAAALTSEQRSEIARQGAKARWGADVPKATHGSPDRPIRIGDVEIPCYVLNNGRRVLAQRGVIIAMGMKRGGAGRWGGDRLANFASGKSVSPFISGPLRTAIEKPIHFRVGGSLAYGYEATVLPDLCEAILSARRAGALQSQQLHLATQCELLLAGLSRVGIIALVDEATGYQEVRDKFALSEILDKYLRKEFAAWAKVFPDSFYKEIFRLRNWTWRGMKVNRPQCVARYTKDLVYARLAPGILEQLETLNPVRASGRRKSTHTQWLTEDIGHPALSQHLHAIVGLMRASDTWDQMKRMVDRAFPKRGDTLQLELFQDDD